MRAMILAAGFGSRLKEITKTVPKCLVLLSDGTTMLDRVVGQLKLAGVTQIIINLHYLGEAIKAHVASMNSYDIQIEFSEEAQILGTGGGVKKAKDFFKDGAPFFLHNSDVWSDINLRELYRKHSVSNAIATLSILNRPTSRPLYFDSELHLVPGEGPSARPFGFTGVQVLTAEFLSHLDSFEGEFSTVSVFLKSCKEGKTIAGHDATGSYWIDMGSPEQLNVLNEHLKK